MSIVNIELSSEKNIYVYVILYNRDKISTENCLVEKLVLHSKPAITR